MAEIDLLFVDADLHAGSTVSICPPDFQVTDGGSYRLNAAQRWLWEQRQKRVAWQKKLARGRSWGLVVNGDAIEGDHHRSHQVVTPDTNKQIEMAIQILGEVATGAAKVWVVHGTDTHVQISDESQIGFSLGAERDDQTGYFFFHHLLLNIQGTVCSFQHHMSTTKRKALEAGALSQEGTNEQACAARAGHPIPSVIGRAHRHIFGMYTDARMLVVASPPWKLLDNHTYKVAPGSIPAIGSYALDWRSTPPGGLPTMIPFIVEVPPRAPQRG